MSVESVAPPLYPPRLSAQQLAEIRDPADRYGLVGLTTAVVGLSLFVPPLGMLVTGALGLVLVVAAIAALRQTLLLSNGVPIEMALGPDWGEEVERLLDAAGRPPGSVQVVVINDAQPRAFACWAPTVGRAIVVSSGLVRLLDGDPRAFRFVLGHELGHLLYHFPYALVLNDGSSLSGMFGPFGMLLRPVTLWWSRHGECSADRLGMVMARSPSTALRVLVALHQGVLPPIDGLSGTVERLVVRRGLWHMLAEACSTHPFLGSRLRAAMTFATEADQATWWTPEEGRAWRNDFGTLWPCPSVRSQRAAASGEQLAGA